MYVSIPETDLDANSGATESVFVQLTRNLEALNLRTQDLEENLNVGIHPTELLLAEGEVANSAYATGLSVTDGNNNTEEGYTLVPETNVAFKGITEFTTNMLLQVATIGGSSITAFDPSNRSADFDSGDVVQVFRLATIDGEDVWYDTGIEKTLTANSTNSTNYTTVNLNVTNLLVDDILYKKVQLTKQVSFVNVGVSESFNTMEKESVQVIDSIAGTLDGISSHWTLQETTTSFLDGIGSTPIGITGTFSQGAGHHYAAYVTNFSASNYINNSGANQLFKTTPDTTHSWSFWWYSGGITGNHLIAGVCERAGGVSNNQGWRLTADSSTEARFYKNGTQVLGGVTIAQNTWYHIVITHNSSSDQTYVYVNNTQFDAGTTGMNNVTSTGGLTLGSDGNGSGLLVPTTVRYEDLQYYTVELSSGQVSSLYNSGVGLIGVSQFTVRERYVYGVLSGQHIKSKVTVPSLSANGNITVTKQGVIKLNG